MNNLKLLCVLLIFIGSKNIFSAEKMSDTASAIAQPAQRSFNEVVRATAWKASSDTSSSSSSKSEITSSVSSTLLGIENNTISSWTNPTKFSELTPFQKIQLKELDKHDQIGKFPQGLSQIIGSYSEEFSKEATDVLWNALKDRSLDEQTRTERVKNAIEQGANVNNPIDSNEYIGSPLQYIIDYGFLDIAEILVKNKQTNVASESPEISGSRSYNTLLLALIQLYYWEITLTTKLVDKKKVFEIIESLLKHHNEIINKILKSVGETILFWSARQDEPELVRLLLKYGANPNISRKWQEVDGELKEQTFQELIKDNLLLQKIYQEHLEEKAKQTNSSSTSSSSSLSSLLN